MTHQLKEMINSPMLFRSLLVPVIFALFACVATPEKQPEETAETKPTTKTVAVAKADEATEPVAAVDSGTKAAEADTEDKPAKPADTLVIVESCKNEPYVKHRQQAMESLNKGLAATKAGRFGVGFRHMEDYDKWNTIHEKLFKAVNRYCNELKQCAGKHAENKDKECAAQAFVYNEWKQKAESFTKKAKAVETSEPDPICSVEPNLADDPACFHGLGDNLEKFCSDQACKEVSDCWRSIGFLDQAIKQADQACRFAHQDLASCRGHMEATKRRKDRFDRCMGMQKELGMPFFPAI